MTNFLRTILTGLSAMTVLFSCSQKTIIPEEPEPQKDIEATGVSVSPDKCTLKVGETVQLTAVITPKGAVAPALQWTSLRTANAKVDENGLVTALQEGTAQIRVATKDMKLYAHCTAGVLRAKDAVLDQVTTLQENCMDIYEEAKVINAERSGEEDETEE